MIGRRFDDPARGNGFGDGFKICHRRAAALLDLLDHFLGRRRACSEPSAATPGSLTTTLAPSVAQSSAISRPMPRPAPVTMMDLPSSNLAIGASPVVFVIPG